MYTVITKGNEVRQCNSIDGVNRDIKHSCIVVNKTGTIIERSSGDSGDPITWPADATSGLQAIVDVKAGTLRFAYDGRPRAQTEFVVSEYVEPFVSVEDSAPVHVLDLIKEWPSAANSPAALPDLPGFKWMFHDGGVWSICGMNGDSEFFEGHWLSYHENKKKYTKPAQPGTKHDHGKPILGAVPPHAELAVGRVLTFGSEKYARGNWDKVEDHENRYMDAALRHLNAHRRGELTDSESGESHLAHAACCILFMLDKQERSC